MMMNNRKKGSSSESDAASFFENMGYEVLERNYLRKTGEIDLILREPDDGAGRAVYVFCEVKARTTVRYGYPGEAVSYGKQQKIYKTAQWYLKEKGLPQSISCRFDVISILNGEIKHIKNAFGGF